MHQDRIRWNAKYEDGKGMGLPSALVQNYHRLAPGPIVLDVAAGTGRNALFLAEQGYQVMALDVADVAVHRLRDLGHSRIAPVQADLDIYPLRESCFDLIVCSYFLDRTRFPSVYESLRPGGILLYETAKDSDVPSLNQPGNRDYLLRTNELLHSFLRMRIVYYEEAVFVDPGDPEKRRCQVSLAAQKGWTGDQALLWNMPDVPTEGASLL